MGGKIKKLETEFAYVQNPEGLRTEEEKPQMLPTEGAMMFLGYAEILSPSAKAAC